MDQTTVDADSTYAMTDTKQPSERVVEAVADAEDADPLDLPPLFGAIDPDALDSLFSSRLGSGASPIGEVSFSYGGYEVTVSADGRVTLDG